ncbi:MAG: hypothetical protein RJB61_558 [Actinomycetota bacterium]
MARCRAHCLSIEHSVPPPVPLSAEHCSTTLPQVIRTDGAKSGTFAVLLSAALFGTTGTVLVAAPPGADAWSAGALRLLVGALTLVALAVLADRRTRRRGITLPPHRWPAVGTTAVGAAGVAVFQLGYFLAVERTGVAVGTVATIGSGPAIAGAAGAFAARHRPDRDWLAGTAVAVTGVVVLGIWGTSGNEASADAVGILLALAAAAGWATFTTMSRRQIDSGTPSTTSMAAVFAGGAVLVVPALAWHGGGWALQGWGPLVVAHLGVLTVGVAYWSYGIALRSLPAPTVITLTLLEPITAAALGIAVVGERLSPAGVAGIALVLAGLAVTGRAAVRGAQHGAPSTVPT